MVRKVRLCSSCTKTKAENPSLYVKEKFSLNNTTKNIDKARNEFIQGCAIDSCFTCIFEFLYCTVFPFKIVKM